MAWSTPRTWAPGETVTAALLNAHLRDNLNVLKTNISDSGDITLPSSVQTDIDSRVQVLSKSAAAVDAATSETNFLNYTVAANKLGTNGQALRATIEGHTAANGANKTFKVYFGGTQVGSTITITNSAVYWRLTVNVHRRGASSQVITFTLTYAAGNGTSIDGGTLTKDLTASQDLKITGTSGTTLADLSADSAIVELLP